MQQEIKFENIQKFTLSNTSYIQDIHQSTTVARDDDNIEKVWEVGDRRRQLVSAQHEHQHRGRCGWHRNADDRVDQLDSQDSNTVGPTLASTEYYWMKT